MIKHHYITADEAFCMADSHSVNKKPFFIAIDFEIKRAMFYPLSEIPDTLHFQCGGIYTNPIKQHQLLTPSQFKILPVPFHKFEKGYFTIIDEIKAGNTYLVNYTSASFLENTSTLSQLYIISAAKFKLLVDDEFLVFSPETFVTIESGIISTFPMKGTIDASVPNAIDIILSDKKEQAEHATIVDLLRNDLSKVCSNVSVKRYRYIEEIRSMQTSLLQVSSEIEGRLRPEYDNSLGTVLRQLLPAGSVSGAPKNSTLEIIRKAEDGPRGFYCGIMGVYDGSKFVSGVLIRFIEQTPNGIMYRSGGGITYQSDIHREYQELIQKIYVPIS